MSQIVMDAAGIKRTLGRLAHEILESNGGAKDVVVVGILRRGWPVAKRVAFMMAQIEDAAIPHGKLDIRPSRDDQKTTEDDTDIPFSIEGKNVVLVDEVIFTGRTIRAAMDALMKHGRPAKVQLAVIIDRGHRELPIQPDFCGKQLDTEPTDFIDVLLTDAQGEDAVVLMSNGERT
ncbi:MAG: bifunctional pyr operon transcriptional regulator/uracil phosphoribosyltransferase PyrR [Fimbriimonadaceae bacterium]|nr:bifunctional pyr operon transcriptional regulator/uracil phosphoribosyltransferase PyrR [Fimbriimonadaceae bacterium]